MFWKTFKKAFSMMEMLIVIGIILGLTAVILPRLQAVAGPKPEENIPSFLKKYGSEITQIFRTTVHGMKPMTFMNFFTKEGDQGKTKQGLVGILSNCRWEPTVISTKSQAFNNNFAKALVGDTNAKRVGTNSIQPIADNLKKLGAWRIYIATGNKKDLIQKDSPDKGRLGTNVYVMLIEHGNADVAEFASTAFKEVNGDDDEKYYNALIFDDKYEIYTGVNDKTVTRSLLGNPNGASGSKVYDSLIDFKPEVVTKILSLTKTSECMSDVND